MPGDGAGSRRGNGLRRSPACILPLRPPRRAAPAPPGRTAAPAAEIVGVLDERELSTRKAEVLTGVDHSEFARIRKAKLDRFTIDRLVILLNRLGQQVDVGVPVRPDGAPDRSRGAAHP